MGANAQTKHIGKEREIKERLTPDLSAALTQPGQSAMDGENQLPPGVVVAPGRWPAPGPLRSTCLLIYACLLHREKKRVILMRNGTKSVPID